MTLLDDVAGRLADDVTFHSPVATYRGRADVAHLLATIGGLVEAVEPVHEVTGPLGRATFFTARLAGRDGDGVLEERYGSGGDEVVQLRLMLRPLEALIPAVKAMGAALAADPLPSQEGGAA